MAHHSIPAYEQDSISLPAGTHYRIRYKASPMERGLALHYHDHFEAFFAISDNIPYTVQGRQYTLETGNLLLIAPLALHQPCAQPGMCERIALRFAPSLPELLLGQDRELVSFLPGDQPARLLQPSPHIQKKLLWLLRGLLQEQAAKELGAALTAQALLTQVFVWCARAADCQQPPRAAADPSASLVQQVLEYMEHSYADRITLADLEQRFFINRYQLSRDFTRLVGCPPHQYLLQKRLLQARHLLLQGASPQQAAAQCGFGDYANFYRRFRAAYGISPKRCRALANLPSPRPCNE